MKGLFGSLSKQAFPPAKWGKRRIVIGGVNSQSQSSSLSLHLIHKLKMLIHWHYTVPVLGFFISVVLLA